MESETHGSEQFHTRVRNSVERAIQDLGNRYGIFHIRENNLILRELYEITRKLVREAIRIEEELEAVSKKIEALDIEDTEEEDRLWKEELQPLLRSQPDFPKSIIEEWFLRYVSPEMLSGLDIKIPLEDRQDMIRWEIHRSGAFC